MERLSHKKRITRAIKFSDIMIRPVCIIPARGGSKRIKGKNYKKFNGTPMIANTINILKKSKIFDKIVVSTDNKKNV